MQRVAANLFLIFGLIASSASWGADLFEIAKPQFSTLVSSEGNYAVIGPAVDGAISRRKLDQGQLFFSMTILAREGAIRYLRDKGFLDAYAVIFCDGVERDNVSFGITQQRWFEIGKKLSQQYDDEGFFPFRTFMYTQQTQYSSVQILIRDGFGNTVGRQTVNIVP